MAAVQPKKPAGGAYGQFMAANRAKFQEELKGQKASEVSKLGAKRWKEVSEAEKEKFQKKYLEVKAQYEKDMATFTTAGGVKASKKRKGDDAGEGKRGKRGKNDGNKPKKPKSAYQVFNGEKRAQFSQEAGDMDRKEKFKVVSNKVSEAWKALSEAQRKPFQDKADKLKAEYNKALEEYRKNAGAGAADEEDEDEDEEEDENE